MTTISDAAARGTTALSAAVPVQLRHVGRSFGTPSGLGQHAVLRDVTLDIAAGEILVILGASGCGKSTLLRLLGGLDTASTGKIIIGGSAVAPHDSRCAVGFQEPRLLPWRSVRGNVALGLPPGTSRSDGKAQVERLLQVVGLESFADHRPREISGGMAQRASLARALARNPGVLLLDEPFGALDALTRLRMQDLLLEVHEAAPTTIVLVTHDVDEALQLGDRIIVMGNLSQISPETSPESVTSISQDLVVPGARPRDRASVELATLRAQLLESFGINRHLAS